MLRYDGTTGAFLGTFVTPDSGGLRNPTFLTFTETNPTTLNYDGTTTAITASALLLQPAIASGSGPLVAMIPPQSVSIRFVPGTVSIALSQLQQLAPSLSNKPSAEASGSRQGLWHAQPAAVDRSLRTLQLTSLTPRPRLFHPIYLVGRFAHDMGRRHA